ncbi:primosomal protein N' [Leifsonia sp. YIM 134122]|uniref:Probable replication restart protein PriA n=1 Tax=Leifsonia stereocauli TaxID=3134136 RepID=A0ABU9W222_9MICO
MPGLIARVLIDSPLPQLDHPFDYSVPDDLVDGIGVGVRVKVPFRSATRLTSGYVIGLVDADDAEFGGRLSALDSVVSSAPVLDPAVWTLARRVADRSGGTASDIVRLAVPPRQVRVEKRWLARRADIAALEATEATEATEADAAAPAAESTVEAVAVTGYPVALANAVSVGERIALRAIPRLVELPGGAWVGHWAITLAELAVTMLASGRSSILAVPDYRDQAQLEAALAAALPAEAVVRLDARQPDAERYAAFLRCLEPEPVVVVGNRASIYAPAAALGLIVVWDDGDPLYAEQLAPYVHTRDAALVRQEQLGCALVLAGNARSVEAQRLIEIGWMRAVDPDRAPRPRVIPTGRQSSEDPVAQAARIPSTAWREARTALETGPVLVQVASPGYSPWIACATCREPARCTRCGGPLGVSKPGAIPACRLCGSVAADWSCSNCQGRTFRSIGAGSGRTADELGRAFPGALVVLSDGDHEVLTVGEKPALVIATRGAEPIAAGGYHAVLLLDGERMLARESLRVGEDCLRWWSNAAALAAPGAPVLLAGATGPVSDALSSWRQDSFAASELADRRALRFPPAVRAASVTGSAAGVAEALAAIEPIEAAEVLGPVPVADGQVRAIVRFDYAAGTAVAGELRAVVVRIASRTRSGPRGDKRRVAPTLRIRFDDPEIL